MTDEIRVPALGESVNEATVAQWYKQVGDSVIVDEILCDLDTDKVAIEVRAQSAGVVKEILAPEGTDVEVNALLAVIAEGELKQPAQKAKKDQHPPSEAKKKASDSKEILAKSSPNQDIEDSPAAKKLMTSKGIKSAAVDGTGKDGRVMKPDVTKFLADVHPNTLDERRTSPPDDGFSPSLELEERVPMSRLRQTIAKRLKSAQNTAAMLTTYNEVDMTNVMEIRNEYKDVFSQKFGIKLGFMSFFVKACCNALLEVPEVNGEIDGTELVFRRYVNMGIAVGTPSGLVVPVIRNANELSFAEIEQTISSLGAKARDGRLALSDMQGGTFSISNGGIYGSLMSSPILNPPQSGILGMHKIQERPIAMNGQVVIRPMMYLALSYDHRIVDGKGAVTFLVRVKEAIEDPRRLLLEV
ncbi:MAG: 2-oxoglutarate dehydrogenase complex dihydrolipoyllysine-residue succinyltransferase [Rhodobacteraceae bacterium]|nr:2-oxoglutarate dehydrogenase complex dihydrolipoyllysine-residue succinyltransferase [Paracoccaceae bacterium]